MRDKIDWTDEAEQLVRAYDECCSLARRERTEGWDRVKKRWEAFLLPTGRTD